MSHAPAAASGLRAEGITVSFAGQVVLRDIDFRVDAGDALAVTGASGSGKSTLCLVLVGALPPSAGRVLLDGEHLAMRSLSDIGYIPQSHALVSGLTAAETVALPMQAHGLEATEIAERTANALTSVGLTTHGDRLVDRLSGGERQRVAIARAIAGDPALIVGDEPTAELDPDNRERVLALLRGFVERGRTVVVATDDDEVLRAFPRSVELEDGAVVERESA